MAAEAVEGQNNSYDAWGNYSNPAYEAVAQDTGNLYYYSDENVVLVLMMAYRKGFDAVVLDNPYRHCHVGKMVDYPTRKTMAAIVDQVNEVMTYCCHG